MFQTACDLAAHFTKPLVVSIRRFDGSVSTAVGTYIVLNDEGWALTTAHVLKAIGTADSDKVAIEEHNAAVAAIESGPGTEMSKRTKKSRVHQSPAWITNYSFWWGFDGVAATTLHIKGDVDVLLTKLDGFDPAWVSTYPKFRRSGSLRPGASLVKVGYPFHSIPCSWDETRNAFLFGPEAQIPLFPMEGIFTRTLEGAAPSPNGYPVQFIETSSPGLRGQSGGPTLDIEGAVCAMQSQTAHYPLGFRPVVKGERGRDVEEHQFLNVGIGVSTAVLEPLFAQHSINVDWC